MGAVRSAPEHMRRRQSLAQRWRYGLEISVEGLPFAVMLIGMLALRWLFAFMATVAENRDATDGGGQLVTAALVFAASLVVLFAMTENWTTAAQFLRWPVALSPCIGWRCRSYCRFGRGCCTGIFSNRCSGQNWRFAGLRDGRGRDTAVDRATMRRRQLLQRLIRWCGLIGLIGEQKVCRFGNCRSPMIAEPILPV